MSNGVSKPNIDNVLNPLTPEQLNDLRDSLVDIAAARAAVEKMREAGLDVGDQLTRLDESEKQARALLKVYDT